MAPPRARFRHRRARRGSIERPVDARLLRGVWLVVAFPLLLAAFTVSRPAALPAPALPPVFDGDNALRLARDLAQRYPDRSPGSQGALGAATWVTDQMKLSGLLTAEDRFTADIPGLGQRVLRNLVTTVAGDSPQAIVVLAHRDTTGEGVGANDNASGTAALVELARGYSAVGASATLRATPAHTILFVSTDGGAFGAIGAERFAVSAASRRRVVAVINLDAIGGRGPPRLELAGDEPRSPAVALVRTAAARVLDETRTEARTPRALWQLVDLGLPFAPHEQGPFVARGVPAVTLTTVRERRGDAYADTADRLSGERLGQMGRAAESLVGSLNASLELAQGTTSYVYLGHRFVRGWAIELVLFAALLPFLAGAIDLFALCRRRRLPLLPALRALRSRILFWAWVGALLWFGTAVGLFRGGPPRPPAPAGPDAGAWPVAGLALLALPLAAGWFLSRDRLLPRRAVSAEERLAGYTVGLLGMAVVALLVVATNPFALVFLLPSLYAWLWLPQLHGRPAWMRAMLFAAGFAGAFLPLLSLGLRWGLGAHAPAYLLTLVTSGYVRWLPAAIALAWAAAAAQLGALAAGRYAPYPARAERPPRGPFREAVRRVVLASRRRRRRAALDGKRAQSGS